MINILILFGAVADQKTINLVTEISSRIQRLGEVLQGFYFYFS